MDIAAWLLVLTVYCLLTCAIHFALRRIQVTFDTAVISYKQILDVFFEEHNPTVRAVRPGVECSHFALALS